MGPWRVGTLSRGPARRRGVGRWRPRAGACRRIGRGRAQCTAFPRPSGYLRCDIEKTCGGVARREANGVSSPLAPAAVPIAMADANLGKSFLPFSLLRMPPKCNSDSQQVNTDRHGHKPLQFTLCPGIFCPSGSGLIPGYLVKLSTRRGKTE